MDASARLAASGWASAGLHNAPSFCGVAASFWNKLQGMRKRRSSSRRERKGNIKRKEDGRELGRELNEMKIWMPQSSIVRVHVASRHNFCQTRGCPCLGGRTKYCSQPKAETAITQNKGQRPRVKNLWPQGVVCVTHLCSYAKFYRAIDFTKLNLVPPSADVVEICCHARWAMMRLLFRFYLLFILFPWISSGVEEVLETEIRRARFANTLILFLWDPRFCEVVCTHQRGSHFEDFKNDWIFFTWKDVRCAFVSKIPFLIHVVNAVCLHCEHSCSNSGDYPLVCFCVDPVTRV